MRYVYILVRNNNNIEIKSTTPGFDNIFRHILGGEIFWVRVFRPVLKSLTLFQIKIYGFPYPISDLTLQIYTRFQTVWGVVISVTLNGLTAYGTSWRPKRCSRFYFFAIHGNTRYSKNGIPDQTDGIYTLFPAKRQTLYLIQTRNAFISSEGPKFRGQIFAPDLISPRKAGRT